MKTKIQEFQKVHRDNSEIAAAGFADFNGGTHLCVDVPDGNFTISCRTSAGEKITFAFCPYKKDGPAKCVDIQRHTAELTVENGDSLLPSQSVILFGARKKDVRVYADQGYSICCVLLHDHKECQKEEA